MPEVTAVTNSNPSPNSSPSTNTNTNPISNQVTAVNEALRAFLKRSDLRAVLGVTGAFATGVAVTRC